MDTWAHRKSQTENSQVKVRKVSMHTFLPSTTPEFTWLLIDGIMEENGLAFSVLKWKFRPANTEGPQEIKDTNTDYQKVARVGE